MRILTTLILSLPLGAAHAFECAEPVPPKALDKALEGAEKAFADLDDVGFRDRVNEVAGILLPCVSQALPPATAARYHRVMALHLFTIGDEASARSALDAAKLADPTYVFEASLLPDSHPLVEHYTGSEPDDKTRNVPEPRVGSIAFDGTVDRARSKTLPALVQLFDEQGLSQSTGYLGPRESLPPYRAIPRQRTTLILSSGGALVASGTLYALAWAQRGNLLAAAQDPTTGKDTLDSKRNRTNALVLGSSAFLGISIGTGVGAALIGER